MLTQHKKALPSIEDGRVVITPGVCGTYFNTEKGTGGHLYIQRWINGPPLHDPPRIEFRYVASISLNRPGTNTWCGAIDLPTTDLTKILPWIATTVEQCNQQLKLVGTAIIEEALADLAGQFKAFLSTLQAEDDEVKKCFAQLPVSV